MDTAGRSPGMPVFDGMVLGRGEEADLRINDPSVSRRHAHIRQVGGLWHIQDLSSRSGTYLNGRLFQTEKLVVGDLIAIGPAVLRFDGSRLHEDTAGVAGASLTVSELVKTRNGNLLLDKVSFSVAGGQFVGILGPSGAGKSTLLDALCGLRPADSGKVLVDGMELSRNGSASDLIGYVPQDDIVPLELPVREALVFSARLRMPKGTPPEQLQLLVEETAGRVGLSGRLNVAVGKLSGGQRKRVSVAAELLGKPRLLFLDEPTSGLDPATEYRLMEMLRGLAVHACTIFCTTHVVQNAHLFDRLAVMQSGRLVFFGSPEEAPAVFSTRDLGEIYRTLEDRSFPSVHGKSQPSPPATGALPVSAPRSAALPILCARQAAILLADKKNLTILLGQPVIIALLVTWVSSDAGLILFFSYVATLWFGCGNAAQEIVREIPMYRRERLIGLGRNSYLGSKVLSLSVLTCIQAMVMYGVMQAAEGGLPGHVGWQTGGLLMTACASVTIGLAISAWAASVLQAVMLVPLILIPQILFSGFMPPAGDFRPAAYFVSRLMPSAAAQSCMDVSLMWNKKISGALRVDHPSAFSNLNRDRSLKNGNIFRNPAPGLAGLATLAGWIVAGLAMAWTFLSRREKG